MMRLYIYFVTNYDQCLTQSIHLFCTPKLIPLHYSERGGDQTELYHDDDYEEESI